VVDWWYGGRSAFKRCGNTYFAADALRRTPDVANQWYQGNYGDALMETGMIGLDLLGARIPSKLKKGLSKKGIAEWEDLATHDEVLSDLKKSKGLTEKEKLVNRFTKEYSPDEVSDKLDRFRKQVEPKGPTLPVKENFHNPIQKDLDTFLKEAEKSINDDYIKGNSKLDPTSMAAKEKALDDATNKAIEKYGQGTFAQWAKNDKDWFGGQSTYGNFKPMEENPWRGTNLESDPWLLDSRLDPVWTEFKMFDDLKHKKLDNPYPKDPRNMNDPSQGGSIGGNPGMNSKNWLSKFNTKNFIPSTTKAQNTAMGMMDASKYIMQGKNPFEIIPITKSQKSKVLKKQQDAYDDAISFTNDWFLPKVDKSEMPSEGWQFYYDMLTKKLDDLNRKDKADSEEFFKKHPDKIRKSPYREEIMQLYREWGVLDAKRNKILQSKIRPEVEKRMDNILKERKDNILDFSNVTPFTKTQNHLVFPTKKDLKKLNNPGLENEIYRASPTMEGVNYSNSYTANTPSITFRGRGFTFYPSEEVAGTGAHELAHSAQNIKGWSDVITKYSPKYNYYTSNLDNLLGRRFADAMVTPSKVNSMKTWRSSPDELHSELMKARYRVAKKLEKVGYSREEAIQLLQEPSDDLMKQLIEEGKLNKHFKTSTSKKEKYDLIRMLPVMLPAVGVAGATMSQGNNEYAHGGKVENIPTWNYPSTGTPIYRDTTEIPPNTFPNGGEAALQQWSQEQGKAWIDAEGQIINETSDIGRGLTKQYFENIGGTDYATQIAEGKDVPHWSAATISNATMAYLGVKSAKEAERLGFHPSASHSSYIRDAFKTADDPKHKFDLYKAKELSDSPSVGEILFFGRDTTKGWTFQNFKQAKTNYPSHSDIIVKKGKDEGGAFVILAGGNNKYDSYGTKKVYAKDLKNIYAGKLAINKDSRRTKLIKNGQIEPLPDYLQDYPQHTTIANNLPNQIQEKLEYLPAKLKFDILNRVYNGEMQGNAHIEKEVNAMIKDRNSYINKLAISAKAAKNKPSFGQGSIFGQGQLFK
jgi:hypothetical protein